MMKLYTQYSFQKVTWPLFMMACKTAMTTNSFSFYIAPTSHSIISPNSFKRTQRRLIMSTTHISSFPNSVLKGQYFNERKDENDVVENNFNPSPTFAVDPNSNEAHDLLKKIGITDTAQQEQLKLLATLVVEWNERLNLISRKGCTVDVVFGRHILPSIALASLPELLDGNDSDSKDSRRRVLDVGTGGGFPGVPLAIIFPYVDFLLVDSVGKKIEGNRRNG